MKKSKKFLCLLLALVMAGSLLLLPAAAANTQQSGAERYPTVYVHGLMGWGARDQIYAVTPYWRSEERRVGKECRSRWSPYH